MPLPPGSGGRLVRGVRSAGRFVSAVLLLGVMSACAQTPLPDAGAGTVWGYVTLVPSDVPEAGGGYGDRRLANVKRVDYSQLKYAVVYAPTSRRELAPLELRIEDEAGGGARLAPGLGATSPAAGLRITNTSASERLVSVPGRHGCASWRPVRVPH